MTKNKECTRYYSRLQEETVAKALSGHVNANSGATTFGAGDVTVKEASLLIECKTCMEDKDSFSIKKEWLEKNKSEAFALRLADHCIAFNFGPGQPNNYIIDEKLMKFLVEKLIEENN